MTAAPGSRIAVLAPAKVNLHLRVLERMPDGYHRLETLFQAVDFCDRLELEVVPGSGVQVDVTGADVGPVEDNLVTRAVDLYRRRTGVETGLRVRLDKVIPAGAGLGGGSSDAGATLRSLDLLHGGLLGEVGRMALGAGLGADVAFFSGSAGLARGEGRGERLTPLPPLAPATLILGVPDVHVATGPAYAALAAARPQGAGPAETGPRWEDSTWESLGALAVNDFEAVVPKLFPQVGDALAALRSHGSPLALLSGSGGAVFGLPWSDAPDECVEMLRAAQPAVEWRLARTLRSLPEPVRVEP